MNLRMKLFLLIGSLFIVIAILSYFLPQILLAQDMEKIREIFNQLIVKHQEADHQERKLTFLNRVQEEAYLINSDLSAASQAPLLHNLLDPSKTTSPLQLWKETVKFIFYNPEAQFVQITDSNAKSIAIAVGNGQLYTAQATAISEDLADIVLTSYPAVSSAQQQHYIGVKLKAPLLEAAIVTSDPAFISQTQKTAESSYYYLYSKDNLPKPKETKQATALTTKPLWGSQIVPHPSNGDPRSSSGLFLNLFGKYTMGNRVLFPIVKGVLAGSVTPISTYLVPDIQKRFRTREEEAFLRRRLIKIFMDNLDVASPQAPDAPLGIAKLTFSKDNLQTSSTGQALLSNELFFDRPLFDDRAYYLQNIHNNEGGVVNSLALIDSPALDNVYIGNTLAFSPDTKAVDAPFTDNMMTIAVSLGSLLEDMAISSELVVFLTDSKSIRFAVNASGTAIPTSYFNNFPINDMVNEALAEVTVDGVVYNYFKMQPVPNYDTYILIIIPQSAEIVYQFKNTMYTEMQAISQIISYQLLAVSLLCLGISLIILGFLSGSITKPIAMLAKATEEVSQGHYSHIDLPNHSMGSDEISVLSNSFLNMVHELQDREKIRGVLNKVVSKEIAEEILRGSIHLGGEEKVITMLFSDIRHFTKMTERLLPQEVISLLNTYMTKMSDLIDRRGGVIDKYIGDEVMALYGAPLPYSDSALRAIITALEMMEALKKWNRERTLENLPEVNAGIGIHTGLVVAGNMGAETRLNYTVLGANVNLASRLCAHAEAMQILITEATLNELHVRESIIVEELPPMQFKGFSEPVKTYAVKGLRPHA